MASHSLRSMLLLAVIFVSSISISDACNAVCEAACKAAGGQVKTPPAPFLKRCEITITVKGEKRRIDVYLPDNYTPKKKWPTWVHVHGAFATSMSPTTLQIYKEQKYVVTASEAIAYWDGIITDKVAPNYIHIYPSSSGTPLKRQIWNSEFWKCSLKVCTNAPDRDFLDAMLLAVKQKFAVGPTFAYGNSNGGMMLYTMYCKSQVWAKNIHGYMIQNSGIGYSWLMTQCRPPAPVPLLQLHGALDTVIQMQPTYPVDGVKFAPQYGAARQIAQFSRCSVKPREAVNIKVKCDPQFCENGDAQGMTSVKCVEFCAQKAGSATPTVSLCVVAGGAHAIEAPYKGWANGFMMAWMKRVAAKTK